MKDQDEIDTEPPTSDPEVQLARDLSEVRLAMGRLYECLEKVNKSIMRVEMAELTMEHRHHVQREKIVAGGRLLVDHERRLRALEISPPGDTAAE